VAKPSIVKRILVWSLISLFGVTAITGAGIGLSAVVSAYSREQQRATAQNQVRLARIEAQRAQLVAQSQIAVARAGAQAQYQQALGIRRAQDEIKHGLTNPYLQYEAIQAQKAVATSGRNNTLIYLPSGSSGVPLVQDPQNVNRLRPRPQR
jgi:regulator of protease activity HflC (stomatin/prohibitin superfamily)